MRVHKLSGKDLLNTLPLSIIVGETSLPKEDYERIMSLGHSAYVATTSSGQSVFGALNSVDPDGAHANFYWMAMRPDPSLAKGELPWTQNATQSEQLAEALRRSNELDPKYTELLRLTPETGISTFPLVIRDIVIDDLPVSRLTLVGDAMHSMAPHRGEGGNTSMQDSLNLARTIGQIALAKDDKANMMELLKQHQEEVLARSRPIVLASRTAAVGAGGQVPDGHFETWQKELRGETKVY